ncbi:hypothetical protein [Leptothoe kymatousa]|uniref:Uncharacterized protein n=1 Tax=Leptothoe kymatousa TAU-MAC 1615 TaxID=2364775 RepID=A0ABS5Y1I7_9CYAN|nr:hypothetical protein [Leptothoe kymatousa]MBT9311666.1 hypothetical protein [Leptothoe kymatousa TAU-MAC 1615]
MHITEHTSTRLKLEATEYAFGLSKRQFAAIAAALIGILILCSGHLTKLHCDRTGPNDIACQRTTISLLDKQTTTLKSLKGAKVETVNGDTYRIALTTDRKTIPLTELSTSDGVNAKRAKVARINEFIHNPQASSLNIKQDDRWTTFGIGGLFSAIGIADLLTKQIKTCTFDKESGKLSLTRQNILRQATIREEKLDEINTITVKERTDNKGKTNYSTKIILHSDNVIQLGSLNNDHAIATTINQFLGIET